MKMSALGFTLVAAAAVGLGACVAQPREEPHHYSKDRDGNRIACYATDVANEYDCVPTRRAYDTAYDYDPYFYDPFWPYWSAGYWWYGPRYDYDYPARPLPPPHHWHRRR